MTSTVVRNGEDHPFPGGLKEIVISCDAEGCTTALNNEQIAAGGGLREMGWETGFDTDKRAVTHRCPAHNSTTVREGREL